MIVTLSALLLASTPVKGAKTAPAAPAPLPAPQPAIHRTVQPQPTTAPQGVAPWSYRSRWPRQYPGPWTR